MPFLGVSSLKTFMPRLRARLFLCPAERRSVGQKHVDDPGHAVQIELNRALYLDEVTLEPGPGWSRCAAGVARVIDDLLADHTPRRPGIKKAAPEGAALKSLGRKRPGRA